MSVTKVLSVTYPDNSPSLPIVGSPPQYNPYVSAGYLRPWFVDGWNDNAIGDSSGGNVRLEWYMRPAADDQPIFVAVTQLRSYTDQATTNSYVTVSPGATWEMYNFDKKLYDVGATNIPTTFVTPQSPQIWGKATINTVGEISVEYSVNTTGKRYRCLVRGWVSDRPFLVPTTVLP